MESRTKLLGHPVHPMLVAFPIGLLASATVFDAVYLATEYAPLAVVSFWNVAAGLLMGLAAAVFGLIDFLAIPRRTRAKNVGLWHGVGNLVVVGLFAAAWLLRLDAPGFGPDAVVFSLEAVGAFLMLATGWLGGELLDRLGVGVDDGAHLDAPNSLSGKPAGAHRAGETRKY